MHNQSHTHGAFDTPGTGGDVKTSTQVGPIGVQRHMDVVGGSFFGSGTLGFHGFLMMQYAHPRIAALQPTFTQVGRFPM